MERYTDDMSTLTISELIDKLTLIYEKYGDIEVFALGAELHQEIPIRGAMVVRASDPNFVLLNRPS
jgi:hypothetical protein